MKNFERIIYGLVITIIIFLTAYAIGHKIHLNNSFISDSFMSLSIMLILTAIAIFVFRKNVSYRISFPNFKNILKPIMIGVVSTIAINVIMAIIIKLLGGRIEPHPQLLKMSPVQVLIFVFFFASIVEETLFRGFLLNIMTTSEARGISIFRVKLSFAVIISALAFGLAHLMLIRTGVGSLFLIRTVIFTFSLGLIAGYYQEKYKNNSYAIIVHMAGNSIAVISAFMMSVH